MTALTDLANRLAILDVINSVQGALSYKADILAQAVRDALSDNSNDMQPRPRQQTGVLQDSVLVTLDDGGAVVGSNDRAAVRREHGTQITPPSPCFGRAGADASAVIAQDIGNVIATTIEGAR